MPEETPAENVNTSLMAKKILIVDDDKDLLLALNMLLMKSGFKVKVMFTGVGVLTNVESYQPDVILLDVFLSGIDGRDICREIKASDSYKQIPIVMISANAMEKDVLDACDAEAFVNKPFAIQDLIGVINKVANKE